MKKKDYYFVAVLLTVVLAASTALGSVADVSAPNSNVDSQAANTGNNSRTNNVYCDTTAYSLMPCISSYDTKTGWETLIGHVRRMFR
jgi:hypothetical protein